MAQDLKGKVAVVTGASRGIGKGIALAFAERGCTVFVTGRTSGDGPLSVETCARQITEAGGEGIGILCDHGVDSEIEKLFTTIGEQTDHIDFLVNNVYKIYFPSNPRQSSRIL